MDGPLNAFCLLDRRHLTTACKEILTCLLYIWWCDENENAGRLKKFIPFDVLVIWVGRFNEIFDVSRTTRGLLIITVHLFRSTLLNIFSRCGEGSSWEDSSVYFEAREFFSLLITYYIKYSLTPHSIVNTSVLRLIPDSYVDINKYIDSKNIFSDYYYLFLFNDNGRNYSTLFYCSSERHYSASWTF